MEACCWLACWPSLSQCSTDKPDIAEHLIAAGRHSHCLSACTAEASCGTPQFILGWCIPFGHYQQAGRVGSAAAGEPGAEWDGVVDRDYIKHRAQKLAKQHDARAKQLSAGGAAPGARTAAAPAQKA